MQKLEEYKFLIRQIEDTLDYLDDCRIEAKNKDWSNGIKYARKILILAIENCCENTSIDWGDWRNDREK